MKYKSVEKSWIGGGKNQNNIRHSKFLDGVNNFKMNTNVGWIGSDRIMVKSILLNIEIEKCNQRINTQEVWSWHQNKHNWRPIVC